MVRGFTLSLLVGFLAGVPLLLISESVGFGAQGIYGVIMFSTLIAGLASFRLAPELHEPSSGRRTSLPRR